MPPAPVCEVAKVLNVQWERHDLEIQRHILLWMLSEGRKPGLGLFLLAKWRFWSIMVRKYFEFAVKSHGKSA